jgi:DNA-binding CsgD family transcriptional regulator
MLQCAGLAFNTRDLETAQRINRQAMSDERFSTEVRLKAAASLAMTCAMAGDPVGSRDAIGFCTGALESGSVEVRALVRHRLAYAHLVLGNYALAELYATECAQLSHAAGFEAIAARAYSLLQAIASATYADVPAVRRYLELCLDSAEASGERSMHVFALEGLVLVACIQGDDDLFEARLGELRAMQGQRPLMHPVWMRFCQALRLAGLGQIDRAISEMSRFDRATLSKPAAAFTEAVLAVLYAGSDHERASAMLERPVLASAERDLESVRYLVYAQAFHALGHWLVGRGRAARRARFPDVNDLTPTDAATISVIGTICSASRQTITTRQLEQFTEPLVGFGLGGYARFLRRILAPAGVHELTRTELEILRELRSGGTTVEVAERLGKSSNTILSHIKSACSKIGCSGRSAAVLYAVNQGWID